MKNMNLQEFQKAMGNRSRESGSTDVKSIVYAVRDRGDEAVRAYTREFDGIDMERFQVPDERLDTALHTVKVGVRSALERAAANIGTFARVQMDQLKDFTVETQSGIRCGQRVTPMDRIAVYAPGGRYPLPSSLLMGAVPARVAGVREIIVCTPPGPDGTPDPVLLAAARIAGADRIFAIGGAQAVAACAYGTKQVPRCDKIVGPGNRYVTAAKQLVYGTVGIDLPAGPSELLVLADETARPERVALEILAQAEHDPDAVVVLVAIDSALAARVKRELASRIPMMPTRDIIRRSLSENGIVVVAADMDEAVAAANAMAPEHLFLVVQDPDTISADLLSFGTLFQGDLAAVAMGDYTAGVNHVLPTGGTARFTGGLSALDFVRLQTTLSINTEGLKQAGWAAVLLADSEGLSAHAESLRNRLRGHPQC